LQKRDRFAGHLLSLTQQPSDDDNVIEATRISIRLGRREFDAATRTYRAAGFAHYCPRAINLAASVSFVGGEP